MESNIVLSNIQLADIFFRFATVGTLFLLFIIVLRHEEAKTKLASLFLITCLIAYVLLTAPIENVHYGWMRPPLLLLTDCTSYAWLAIYWHKVHGASIFKTMPKWSKLVAVSWLLWLSYFFIVEKGMGLFHDIHHAIGLSLLIFIVVDAIRDFDDVLSESRRDFRKLTITIISVYLAVLTLVEVFFRTLKDHWLFSLVNALTMLLLALFIVYRRISQPELVGRNIQQKQKSENEISDVPISPLTAKLTAIMETDFFTQNGLSISKLAEAMDMPAHQLRVLINNELGFDNFSQFINSYRVPLVCERLEEPLNKDIPILTLALEAGYNSIAPFNRAFKELKGVTPSEYRRLFFAQIQK